MLSRRGMGAGVVEVPASERQLVPQPSTNRNCRSDAGRTRHLYEAKGGPTTGALVLHEPRPEPWGRSVRYRDLDGNTVELTQPN